LSSKKPRIGVDLDDVIFDLAPAFCEYSNEKFGTQLTPFNHNEHWAKIWGQNGEFLPHDELMDRWHEMIRGNFYFDNVSPVENAAPILNKIKNLGYEMVVLTSRSANNHADNENIRRQTRASLDKYYPNIFDEVHFMSIWAGDNPELGDQITKSKLFEKLDLDYLIDDQTKHINAINKHYNEPRGILFGHFAHQKNIPPNTPHFENWNEDIVKYFENKINDR